MTYFFRLLAAGVLALIIGVTGFETGAQAAGAVLASNDFSKNADDWLLVKSKNPSTTLCPEVGERVGY